MTQNREKIIARAWKDPAFKKKLLSDPKSALKEMGVNVPANATIKIIEDKQDAFTFVLPQAPVNLKAMSEAEMERIAGGTGFETDAHCGSNAETACGDPS